MVNIMGKKINLVLGGGGANCIASIGVLIELLNCGNNITHITGTSAGAIIGGLYAAFNESAHSKASVVKYLHQLSVYDFEQFKDKDYLNFVSFYGKKLLGKTDFSTFGLYKGKTLHNFLLESTSYMTFDELKKTDLYVTACEATTGTLIVFSKKTTPDIRIADAMVASCCIQGVFKPFKIKARNVVGGIFVNNSIKEQFDVKQHVDHPMNIYLQTDSYLYL